MHRRVAAVLFWLILICAGPRVWGQTLYDFNLPPQELVETLRAIGRQTTTNILFDSRVVEHVTAPAVHGQFSMLDAINRALAGTGLAAQQAAANTLLVRPETQIKTALQDREENAPAEAAQEGLQPVRLALDDQSVPEAPQNSTDSRGARRRRAWRAQQARPGTGNGHRIIDPAAKNRWRGAGDHHLRARHRGSGLSHRV